MHTVVLSDTEHQLLVDLLHRERTFKPSGQRAECWTCRERRRTESELCSAVFEFFRLFFVY
jgi:hypothetical protein